MKRFRSKLFVLACALFALTILLLAGCERPDPEEAVVEAVAPPTETPTAVPTPLPTSTPGPTVAPVQIVVVIIQPTASAPDPVAQRIQTVPPTATPEPQLSSTPEPVGPTPIPSDYYLGWGWTRGLIFGESWVEVDNFGLTLRDRPSVEGRKVGLVVGQGDVVVVGRERCGYTPILVPISDLLSRVTPRPEVQEPEPLEREENILASQFVPKRDTISGWAFTEELTILGDTAITGQFGINLRIEPCRYAENSGFIPAGANVIVTGPPVGDYSPVLVDDDVIQPPFDTSLFEEGRFFLNPATPP